MYAREILSSTGGCAAVCFELLNNTFNGGVGGCAHRYVSGIVNRAATGMFVASHFVVGQEGDGRPTPIPPCEGGRSMHLAGLEFGYEPRCLFNIFLVCINAVDERNTDLKGRAELGYEADIFEDALVGNARVAFVLLGIHDFQIYEEQVGFGSY